MSTRSAIRYRLDTSEATVQLPLWWMEEFCRFADNVKDLTPHEQFMLEALHNDIVMFRRHQAAELPERKT